LVINFDITFFFVYSGSNFTTVDPDLVLQAFGKLCMKPDGSYKTHSTPEGYRCALLNYCSSEGIPTPKQFQKPLNDFINGVKKVMRRAEGTEPTKKVKEKMLCVLVISKQCARILYKKSMLKDIFLRFCYGIW
jgi:hypothetical protein